MAAFFTVSGLEKPVESLEDLVKQYKILYAPVNNSAEMQFFERMANIENMFYEHWKDISLNDSLSPVERSELAVWDYPIDDKYTKMWKAIKKNGMPNSVPDAVNRVLASTPFGGFAFIGDATDVRYHALQHCDLQKLDDEFSKKPYAIGLPPRSPLKEKFDSRFAFINFIPFSSKKK